MKKAKLFISALFLMLGVTLSAQNVTVKGTVRDASTGDGVPFAAIQVKGTSTGIATDANGVYSMTVPSNATLVFSSIGYITEETAVNGRSVIDVALKPDTEVLEGTVVVGYGFYRPFRRSQERTLRFRPRQSAGPGRRFERSVLFRCRR